MGLARLSLVLARLSLGLAWPVYARGDRAGKKAAWIASAAPKGLFCVTISEKNPLTPQGCKSLKAGQRLPLP